MKQNNNRPVVLIIGTRPEGIKMIPLYKALQKEGLPAIICSTMQHDQLLGQVFTLFDVKPDFNLDIMRHGQDLFYLTQSVLQKTKEIFSKINPSLVLVQGDTTSTMAAAMAAFYLHIPVGHVEAGLRTDDIYQPFPEEMNRRSVSIIAKYHFAPTQHAVDNLIAQGIKTNNIFCTGNTVVDALRIIQEKIDSNSIGINPDLKQRVNRCIQQHKKIILLTTHRRESFNGGIENILQAMKTFLKKEKDVFCFYPYHPNPHVIAAIEKTGLTNIPNIHMCEPIAYKEMIYLLLHAQLIATDSGGIQEEAVSLGKPVLILREKTERPEGIWAGLAKIVGTDKTKITKELQNYITFHQKEKQNVYGDGYASEKIVEIIKPDIATATKKNNSPCKEINEPLVKATRLTLITKQEELPMKKVCMFGLGYIGLPTAIILAESGFHVTGFDIDKKKIAQINKGDPIIEEPEIFEKLQFVLQSKRFYATDQYCPADYFIIAVPTPFKEGKKADLSYVYQAAESIANVLKKGDTVIVESTIPVGTTQKVATLLQKKSQLTAGTDFFVAHCPERVLPGKIFKELVENDRIIGGINKASTKHAALFYQSFVDGKICTTKAEAAEMIKLIENSSRDVQIAFAHQVAAMACEEGLNPYEIIELANKHPRVNILKPSCGVGGHCIAVDPWFLVESFPKNSSLLRTAREINDNRPDEIIQKIIHTAETFAKTHNKKPNISLLGLTYKPDVDDLRESPALRIAQIMSQKTDMNVYVTEPHIKQHIITNLFGSQAVSLTRGIQESDIIVYLVAHKRFKVIDKKLLTEKIIIDTCGITYTPSQQDDAEYRCCENGMLDFFITNRTQHDNIET